MLKNNSSSKLNKSLLAKSKQEFNDLSEIKENKDSREGKENIEKDTKTKDENNVGKTEKNTENNNSVNNICTNKITQTPDKSSNILLSTNIRRSSLSRKKGTSIIRTYINNLITPPDTTKLQNSTRDPHRRNTLKHSKSSSNDKKAFVNFPCLRLFTLLIVFWLGDECSRTYITLIIIPFYSYSFRLLGKLKGLRKVHVRKHKGKNAVNLSYWRIHFKDDMDEKVFVSLIKCCITGL